MSAYPRFRNKVTFAALWSHYKADSNTSILVAQKCTSVGNKSGKKYNIAYSFQLCTKALLALK